LDIYYIPKEAVAYRPRLARNIRSKLQVWLPVPEDAQIILCQERVSEQHLYYCSIYLQQERWYRISISLMKEKNKWTFVSVTKLYGETFRADLPGMWRSRDGYRRAMEEQCLDPQIAFAVDLNFFNFMEKRRHCSV
jgi:hypothetical protein